MLIEPSTHETRCLLRTVLPRHALFLGKAALKRSSSVQMGFCVHVSRIQPPWVSLKLFESSWYTENLNRILQRWGRTEDQETLRLKLQSLENSWGWGWGLSVA